MAYDDIYFPGDQRDPPEDGSRGSDPASIPPPTGAPLARGNQGGNTYQYASKQIQDAYRRYLGRDATPQDIGGHLSGGRYFAPENVQHAINVIMNSEDARIYSASQAAGSNTNEDAEKADAKKQMQDAYLEHLEREMSDEEFEKWWSGGAGWGDAGIEGLPGWLRGVEHEGNRLKGLNTGAPPPRTGQAPGGFDQTKWESEHGSMKYDAGGFLAGLTKPSEVKAMVESADFQARFGGATFDGKDKINFNGIESDGVPVYEVDVLMRANKGADTSGGFWWGAGSGDGTTDNTGVVNPSAVNTSDPSPVWAGFPPDSPLAPPQLNPGPNAYGMMGPGGGGGTMGQMITPYNPLATYSPEAYVPPAPYRPPAYAAPTPFARDEYVSATPFESPTAADMAADPSYQFRLQQGQDALERSGAARGVTNTGGTLKDILDYGQNAASQEYGNVYGRMRDTYDTAERNRFNAYEANFGNALNAYGMNERNRAGVFDRNELNRATAYNTTEANRFQGYTTNEIARLNENQTAENRRAGAYNTNLGAYQNQQRFGLQAQGQGFDQSFRNWQQQYNQQRGNRTDSYNQMFNLGGA